MEWLQHNADVAVIECQPSDVGIWQQRLEARARQEVGGITSHKPTTWAELTDLICRYMIYRDMATYQRRAVFDGITSMAALLFCPILKAIAVLHKDSSACCYVPV